MKRVRRFFSSINETFRAAARAGHVTRIVGVLNIANALRIAWRHEALWAIIFVAGCGVYLMWLSALVVRELTFTIPIPSPSVIAEMRRRAEEEIEVDAKANPKKIQ